MARGEVAFKTHGELPVLGHDAFLRVSVVDTGFESHDAWGSSYRGASRVQWFTWGRRGEGYETRKVSPTSLQGASELVLFVRYVILPFGQYRRKLLTTANDRIWLKLEAVSFLCNCSTTCSITPG